MSKIVLDANGQPRTKISQLRELMQQAKWREALAMAAKFQDLGAQREAILDAHEALNHRDFYEQLGKNPDELVRKGIAALGERYLNERGVDKVGEQLPVR